MKENDLSLLSNDDLEDVTTLTVEELKFLLSDSEITHFSDSKLEDLEDLCVCKGFDDLHDLVIAEMLRRPDFQPSTYSLQFLLQDCGWEG